MSVQELREGIPSWIIGLVVVLFVASLSYGFLIRRNLFEPIAWWILILEFALLLFAVVLFYRFVVAVETIAEKM